MRFSSLLLCLVPAAGLAQEPLEYTVRFPDATGHYADVQARVPTEGRPEIELMMAVWTPGSYLVREYARHVEALAATAGGVSLSVEKIAKNRWKIATGGARQLDLSYRIYARELSVRTNFVEGDFALLNGAATFMTLADAGDSRAHDVRFLLPSAWRDSITALPRHPDGDSHHYRAPDFDTLVDSPVLLGNPVVHQFQVGGARHRLANLGGAPFWDEAGSLRDVEKIVETTHAFWGEVPYDDYVFLNAIVEAGGGLEHKGSTLMLTSRWRARDPERYRGWLRLVSHEFFHTWNVKRLRPATLGPFDYENENYSRSLWIAEGLTSYYDSLLVWRAGLLNEKQYLKLLSERIESLQTTPGRLVQPVEQASFDAWIKAYRRDENSPNTSISYYTKGALIGFLLDVEIRRLSGGRRSLDDVMRAAWLRYSAERGYTPEQFRAIVSEVAGQDLSGWLESALETTRELDYAPALRWYGLRFADPDEVKKKEIESRGGSEEDARPEAWLGLEAEAQDGGLVVQKVVRETPALRAGLNVGDELIGLDGFRVPPEGWEERLKQYQPGDAARLLVARRERLLELDVVFGEEPPDRWKLERDPDAKATARSHLEALRSGR